MAKLDINSLLGNDKLTDLINSSASGGSKVYDVVIGTQNNSTGYTANDVDRFLATSEDLVTTISTYIDEIPVNGTLNILLKSGSYYTTHAFSGSNSINLNISGEAEGVSSITIEESNINFFTNLPESQSGLTTLSFKNLHFIVHPQTVNATTLFNCASNNCTLENITFNTSGYSSSTNNTLLFCDGLDSTINIVNCNIDLGPKGLLSEFYAAYDLNILNSQITSTYDEVLLCSISANSSATIRDCKIGGKIIGSSNLNLNIYNSEIDDMDDITNTRMTGCTINNAIKVDDSASNYIWNNLILDTNGIYNNTKSGYQNAQPFDNATVTMNIGPGITNILVEK